MQCMTRYIYSKLVQKFDMVYDYSHSFFLSVLFHIKNLIVYKTSFTSS